MTAFGSETFRQVSALLAQTAEDCLHNIACLKDTTKGALFELRELDTSKVAQLLCSEKNGTKTYCILAQAVVPPDKPDGTPQAVQLIRTGEEQRYLLNSIIMNANAGLLMARNGKLDLRKSAAALGATYDDAALRATALSEAYLHCSKTADNPDIGQFLVMLLGLINKNDPLDDARRTAAFADLQRLRLEYQDRINRKLADLPDRAFDRGAVEKVIPNAYVNYTPIRQTEDDEPGAKVINDVWLPERYATPLMQSLAAAQATAMASRTAREANPKGWLSRLLQR